MSEHKEIPPHPAITAFCRIITGVPEKSRSTAVGFLCSALGQPAEPTGIPFSPDRQTRHLYWDHVTVTTSRRPI